MKRIFNGHWLFNEESLFWSFINLLARRRRTGWACSLNHCSAYRMNFTTCELQGELHSVEFHRETFERTVWHSTVLSSHCAFVVISASFSWTSFHELLMALEGVGNSDSELESRKFSVYNNCSVIGTWRIVRISYYETWWIRSSNLEPGELGARRMQPLATISQWRKRLRAMFVHERPNIYFEFTM